MINEEITKDISPVDQFINKLGVDIDEGTTEILYKLLENVNGDGHQELLDSMSEDTVSNFLTHVTEEL